MTTILTIASILLAASFTGVATWRMKCLPESISALVYVLRYKWLWTLWIWVVSLLTLIPVIDRLSNIGMEALGFGSLACLAFCGAMPLIDKDNTDKHWIFGVSGCALSQLCVLLIDANWLSAWMAFVFLMGSVYVQPDGKLAKTVEHKGVFVAECVCYVSLVGALLTN